MPWREHLQKEVLHLRGDAMNICEIAILKLIEQKKLTEEGGKIFHLFMKHKALTIKEIEYFTGIRYDLILKNIVYMLSKNIVSKKGEKIMICDGMHSLELLIENADLKKIRISQSDQLELVV